MERKYIDIIYDPGQGPFPNSWNEQYLCRYYEEGIQGYYQDGRKASVKYMKANALSNIPAFWYEELPDFNTAIKGNELTNLFFEIRIIIDKIKRKYCSSN